MTDRPILLTVINMTDSNILFGANSSLLETNDNERNSTFDVLGPEYHHQMRMVILSIMIATSLIGNVIMCLHISRKSQKRNRVHLLFTNLAIADLLVTCFAMTSQLVWECMGREWVAGAVFCPIFKVLQTFTMVSSNYLIVTIALDRHVAIVYPMTRNPRTRLFLITAWLASLVPSLPNVYIFQEYTTPSGKVFCVAKFYTSSLSLLDRQLYMAFIFLSVFILPIFIIVGLYTRILYVIWTQSKTFQRDPKDSVSVVSTTAFEGCTTTNSQIPRAKIKTLKMTLTVVATFLATCLPYLIQEMIIAFGDPLVLNENLVAMSGIISASNSTLNPYIYFLYNSKAHVAKKITNSICGCALPIPVRHTSRSDVNSSV